MERAQRWKRAGVDMTSAAQTAMLGFQAGHALTSGANNIFIGYQSGFNVTTASNNVLIGSQAGLNTTGQANIFLGNNAGVSNTTGTNQFVAGGDHANWLISDVHFGRGIVSATPSAYTVHGTGGSGTDIAGADIIVAGGKGTGAGVGGNVIFQTAVTGSTGSTLNALSERMRLTAAGNLGIGTTTPWRTLSVNGTVSLAGLTSDSADSKTLCLTANNEVVAIIGTSCITSSQRFKNSILPLDGSSGLAEVLKLTPVCFQYNSDIGIPGTQVGFIAEQVQQVDPRLVVLDASSTPFTVRYENLTAVLAKAIRDIAQITGVFKDNLVAWLGNAENGIHDLFAANIHAQNELCVGSTCVTAAQFQAMAAAANQSTAGRSPTPPPAAAGDATDTPPVIKINGDNPATIHVGDTYDDLGATITSPQPDLNLGIHLFLNSSPVDAIQLDTNAVATDTIDYVVTDQSGLTSTSTRTVIIESNPNVATTSPSAAATSTAQ